VLVAEEAAEVAPAHPADDGRRNKRPVEAAPVFEEEDEDAEIFGDKKGKGKKKKNRQLVFDEKTGGMVVKRQRKSGRGGGDWNNWDE
jgi:hypothetical protein